MAFLDRTPSDAATLWSDAATAERWMAGDDLETMLALPRRLVAVLAANDGLEVRRVLDVASGPGGFLEMMLDAFPDAEGVWFDVSDAMRQAAEKRLFRFGSRVSFFQGDMASLADAGLPAEVDLLVSSRASHHLHPEELAAFYAGAVGLLRPGGWIANLDHVALDPTWEARLKAAREEFRPPRTEESSHSHDHGKPSLDHHVAALEAAGVTDLDTPWRAFYTVLLAARRAP